MNAIANRFTVILASAFLLSFLPISLESSASMLPSIRVNEACGQATSCKRQRDMICSTHHGDHEGWACYTGCSGGDG